MPKDRPVRMTPAQYHALGGVDENGRLHVTDRRTMQALVRRGWARQESKRKKTWWIITESGRAAYANSPQVAPPRPRPHWPEYWQRNRLAPGRYVAEGHEIIQPARGMLWRVLCPSRAPDDPTGYRDTLAEAVELLAQHLWQADATCHAFHADPAAHPPQLNAVDPADAGSAIDRTDPAIKEEPTT